jgi:ABC-type transport system involved in cytochrome c biogenesis permease component
MTGAVVWKECREQWPAWAAVGAVALLLPAVATLALGDQPVHREWLQAFRASVLAIAALAMGVLTAAALFAGERESGTLPFLDSLPAARRQLWRRKVFAGLVVLAAQVAVLAVAGRSITVVTVPMWHGNVRTFGPDVLAACAALGFGVGLLASVRRERRLVRAVDGRARPAPGHSTASNFFIAPINTASTSGAVLELRGCTS